MKTPLKSLERSQEDDLTDDMAITEAEISQNAFMSTDRERGYMAAICGTIKNFSEKQPSEYLEIREGPTEMIIGSYMNEAGLVRDVVITRHHEQETGLNWYVLSTFRNLYERWESGSIVVVEKADSPSERLALERRPKKGTFKKIDGKRLEKRFHRLHNELKGIELTAHVPENDIEAHLRSIDEDYEMVRVLLETGF